MDKKDKDFFKLVIPSLLFKELANIPKGDLGEKAVEFCFMMFGLKEGKDYRKYPRSDRRRGEYHPDFSDDVEGKKMTFMIEVKNLGPSTRVTPLWIDSHVITRYPENAQTKVLVIFGGEITPKTPDKLRNEGIHFIRYENPIAAENFIDLIWELKDELLDIFPIRRMIMVSICSRWKGPPKLSPPFRVSMNYFTDRWAKKDGPFFTFILDEDKLGHLQTFSQTSKVSREWIEDLREPLTNKEIL